MNNCNHARENTHGRVGSCEGWTGPDAIANIADGPPRTRDGRRCQVGVHASAVRSAVNLAKCYTIEMGKYLIYIFMTR